nr:putative capsid protein [Crucivirus sp.]
MPRGRSTVQKGLDAAQRDMYYNPTSVPRSRKARAPAKRRPARISKGGGSKATGNRIRSAGEKLGQFLGNGLGGPAGGIAGSMLGKAGGAMISKIFGHGDYAVSNAESLKENNLVLSNAAQMPQFGTGKVIVNFTHREFLGDVFSSSTASTFKIDSYPINPALSVTFPWLSGVVGAKFQQYRINGMSFEFRSMSSDALNSTNTALGSVIMSTDYDSADATFTSKQEMENTEFGVSCKPSVNMIHGIECARAQTPVSELYLRAFDVPSGKDIRLYDMGRFSIASTGCQGTNVNLGELWVSYDIDVFKAIENVPAYLTPFAQYAITGATASAPFGTSRAVPSTVTNAADQIGLTFASANKVQWPVNTDVGATYMIVIDYVGAAAAAFTPPSVTCGNGMYFNTYHDFFAPSSAAVSANIILTYVVQYKGGATPAALPYVNVGNFTWAPAGGIAEADIWMTQVSGLYGGVYTIQTA